MPTDTHPDPRSRREILDALANLWKAARPFAQDPAYNDDERRLQAALRAAFPAWSCPICHAPQGNTPHAAICDGCQAQNHRSTGAQP